MAQRDPVRALAGVLAIALSSGACAEPPDENVTELELVRVVAATPLAGSAIDAAKLPYAVQSADDEALRRAQVQDLADFMTRRFAGVGASAAQGNPLQPDIAFRGYTATPLLGGAQGLAVYLDGVRVNEVFGDTVNWDLIPTGAIERVTLAAGNPVYGLNALGGALAIRTKTGFSDPGTRADVEGGAFGRTDASIETAGHDGDWGWYARAHRFDEDGWRDLSPSDARNLYATLSWRGPASFDLHLASAHTDLTGNGPAPVGLLARRRAAIFTAPDETANDLGLIAGEGHVDPDASSRLSWNLFHRRVDTRSFNGDATDFASCEDDAALLCGEDGARVRDQHGQPLPSAYDAVDNIGLRRQAANGATLQLALAQPLAGRENRFAAGIDAGDGRLRYTSAVEAAVLQSDRSTSVDSGLFVPAQALAVDSRTRTLGVYATDTLSLGSRLALTLSARYNRSRIAIGDPTGNDPDLDGRHAFARLNPAAGFSWRWSDALNAYGGYSESTRAPTPVELTCADPAAPCRLPNQFLSDPPLRQVVAKGWEGGLRGNLGTPGTYSHLAWRAGFFRSINHDDILFQATGGTQSNEGFFANVGATRRQGLEASLSGTALGGRLDWYANGTLLDATYRVAFEERSAHHPAADADGRIDVQVGDRIPGLPRQSLKIGADFAATPALSVGADLQAFSGQYLRGDEANRLAPIAGYAVLNLRATRALGPHATLYARIDNAFDRRYATFGTLGDASGVLPGLTDPRFETPGAPRAAWVGVRVTL